MKSIILVLAFIGCLTATELNSYTFEEYLFEYGKIYEGEEFMIRKQIFEMNLNEIIAHNSNANASYEKGINQFTDQTPEETMRLNGYKISVGVDHKMKSNVETFKPTGIKVPDSFDWREKKVLSGVKNQGSCGSCWTFSSAQTLESHWTIATGQSIELSEQQISSCAPNPRHCGGTGGCGGGTAQIAFQHVIDAGGIASETTYPYKSFYGQNYKCIFDKTKTPPVAHFSSYVNIETNQYEGLIEALVTKGPIAVSVDASSWSSYRKGVFTGCNTSSPDVNHAVQLVGYGTDPQFGDYWTIRNSWGPNWGENGFIRIKRTKTGELCGIDKTPQDGSGCDGGPSQVEVCGMCGILFDNTFPVVTTQQQSFLNIQE